jgi:hypothetical protein
MSLQSERIQLVMHHLSLTELEHGYEALAEQAAQENRRGEFMQMLKWNRELQSGTNPGIAACGEGWAKGPQIEVDR